MMVREHIEARLRREAAPPCDDVDAHLPGSLRRDGGSVRLGLLRRLSASRGFALGDRTGALGAAQRRSGQGFRLDVRQRVIVKALVSRHAGRGAARGAALAKHVSYLGRGGAGHEGARPSFFDRQDENLDGAAATRSWGRDRHHFRFIISPEHGDRLSDLQGYVREVMARVAQDLGAPQLCWLGTCHFDTDQPHAHVLVRGRRTSGRDLVIARSYVAYGFRARAQEVAQERLGDLSRQEAERRIWRETQADRFTGFDRRLLAAADGAGRVPDGVGRHDAWAALTRGRLRHLEALGLAVRCGPRYQLAPDLEERLRTLQLRRDVIRTLNQRRLEGVQDARVVGAIPVRGRVVQAGHHDELGAAGFVVVRAADGVEYYGRLDVGQSLPRVGAELRLTPGRAGALAQVIQPPGLDQVL